MITDYVNRTTKKEVKTKTVSKKVLNALMVTGLFVGFGAAFALLFVWGIDTSTQFL